MTPKRLSLLLTLLALFQVRGGAAEPYAILPATESPDGRYGIGWGMKGVENIEEANPLERGTDAVENYIVDLKEKKIVSTLPSSYWQFQSTTPNHRDFELRWSGDSAIVVILYTLRWGDLGLFEAVRLADGKAIGTLDLGKSIETPFRAFLAKTWSEYAKRKNLIDPLFSALNAEGSGILTVNVMGGMPGDKSGESYSDETTVRFSVAKSGENELKCSVLGVAKAEYEKEPPPLQTAAPPVQSPRPLPLQSAEPPLAGAAAAADKRLNVAYKALQGKLDSLGKESLKTEQRAWLLERDKIGNDEEKTQFVEKRAVELENRAKEH
jgi:hypothetical protein